MVQWLEDFFLLIYFLNNSFIVLTSFSFVFIFIGVICGPLLLLWITIRGDVETTLNFRYLFSIGFQVSLHIVFLNARLLEQSVLALTLMGETILMLV